MTAQPHEPTPSEVIGPETLDQALLVVVVRQDGTAVSFVSSQTDRALAAEWMRQAAGEIATATAPCPVCGTTGPCAD